MGSAQSACGCSREQPQTETLIQSPRDLVEARRHEHRGSDDKQIKQSSPASLKGPRASDLSTEASKGNLNFLVSPRKSNINLGGARQLQKNEESPQVTPLNICHSDLYEGETQNGQMHGKGTLFVASAGLTYTGEFANNLRHGHGSEVWNDGRRYTGDFKYDKKDGYGELTLPDGSSYCGMFVSDRFEGFGVFRKPGNYRYVGNFHQGLKHGNGKIDFDSGDYYDGSFFRGQMHGQGMYYSERFGFTYQGPWANGKQHGVGFVTEPGQAKTKAVYQQGQQMAILDDPSN